VISRFTARRKADEVLCGRPRCRGRLAQVREDSIETLPGWPVPSDGTWRMSRRSKQRTRQGGAPRFRTPVIQSGASGRRAAWAFPEWARSTLDDRADFICPVCDAVNDVDPSALVP
jgi:hypothetical protein